MKIKFRKYQGIYNLSAFCSSFIGRAKNDIAVMNRSSFIHDEYFLNCDFTYAWRWLEVDTFRREVTQWYLSDRLMAYCS